jgi:hypothetical protein
MLRKHRKRMENFVYRVMNKISQTNSNMAELLLEELE